ncbi:ubiquitin-conjugating enzyme E2-binding protein [Massariosphaeria phaeospora]|uniref:Ubiquitin-conjugating enzyme E2-binding protein n=1 Tax=Massariosphaeria phaeospora TaxID=100035 RepID=A0A7C8I2U3_9PLEO|nr:ubiquitin-conjugating enzyme E2-binding protein [Massariosphaeria phaeospora]
MATSTLPASAYEALELPSETVRILTNPKPRPNSPASTASPNLLQNVSDTEQQLSLNESSIILYAELLLHIRTVTLYASLRTYHTRETKAQLSSNDTCITVTHEGISATIRLPIKVDGGGDAALSLPAQPPSKDLTLRLQIEEREGTDLLGGTNAEARKVNLVPWDGASLRCMESVEIACKNCHAVVVTGGKISGWRDLPSENWAEMMDFWHCHKPDEHHLHDHTHETSVGQKGYAAGNRLNATEGVGFVDLASVLLKEQDCEGAQVSNEPSQVASLVCKQCKHPIGTPDESSEGWRIWKWSIGVNSASMSLSASTTYSTQKWISARLLFLIENQGVRKFHVYPDIPKDATSTPSLLLWVFTPDLLFSSSVLSDERRDPTRSIKVFYQSQTFSPPKPGEPESASIEDVPFPPSLFEELKRALSDSQTLLPSTARKFQGWNVGLLERFDFA